MADLDTNLAIIEEFTQRLQVAVIGAEQTTANHEEWFGGPIDGVIATPNGQLKTLRGQIAEWKAFADSEVSNAILGYDSQFLSKLQQYDVDFTQYLIDNIALEVAVPYSGGLNIDRRTQSVVYNGVTYYWGGALPYVTTGDFGTETDWLIAPIKGGIEIPKISFASGGTLLRNVETVVGDDGLWYFWTGSFPKVILNGSTLASAGGLGDGAFKVVAGTSPMRGVFSLLASAAGYPLNSGSFEYGALVSSNFEALPFFGQGRLYRWNGLIPKTVNVNSSPATQGGLAPDAWVEIVTASGSIGNTLSETPPVNPVRGQTWASCEDFLSYVWTGNEWVEDHPSVGDYRTSNKWRQTTTVAEVNAGVFVPGDLLEISDAGNALYNVVLGGVPNGINVLDAGGGNTAVKQFVESSAISYGDRSIEFATDSGIGIGQRLINRINAGTIDANVLVVGDSTGNETSEWVYQVALYLADKYPTHTINYYLWNTGIDDYDPVSVISIGSGSFSINIYNGSISGSTCQYFLGQRFTKVFANKDMDLIIQNYGHNQGTSGDTNRISFRLTESVSQFIQAQPLAEIVLTLQNEDTSVLAFSERQANATASVASLFGLAVLDVRAVFLKQRLENNINDWLADIVHPNALGSQKWAEVVIKSLECKKKHNGCMINPLSNKVYPNMYNPFLYDWVYTNELPAGFTKVGTATISKDSSFNESLNWSLKAENGAATLAEIRFDLANILKNRPKGSDLTLAVRLYVPASSGSNSGRIELTSNLGSISNDPYSEVRDGWTWRIITLDASFLDSASTLRGSVYVGNIVGDIVYIDRICPVHGRIPYDSAYIPIQLDELYFPENVNSHNGSTITVASNQVNVTDTPAAYAEFYITVSGLQIGKQYTITWSSPAASGSCYVYSTGNRSGAVINNTSINTDTLTWVANAETNSVAFNAGTGTLTLEVSNISVIPN